MYIRQTLYEIAMYIKKCILELVKDDNLHFFALSIPRIL